MARHSSHGGAKAHHIAESGRIAQRAAHVAAVGDGQHAGGQGGSSPATAAACGPLEIVGIASGAKECVERIGAEAEFGHIGFADDDGSRLAHAGSDFTIGLGHGPSKGPKTEGGGKALCVFQILHRQRQAAQRTAPFAACAGLIPRARHCQRFVPGQQVDDGVDLRIEPLDLIVSHRHQLGRGQRPRTDGLVQLAGALPNEAGLDRGHDRSASGGSSATGFSAGGGGLRGAAPSKAWRMMLSGLSSLSCRMRERN